MLAALLLASACSSDSSVSFDSTPDLPSAGGFGGSNAAAGRNSGSSGSDSIGGTEAAAGTAASEEGGSSLGGSAGSGSAGADEGSAGDMTGGMGGNLAGGGSAGASAGAGGSKGGEAGSAGTGGSAEGGSGGSGGSTSCTNGLFNGHSYAFCGVVDSAMLAFAKCESLNMSVVSIESRAENLYVQGKQTSTWLGGSDEANEGAWRWASSNVLFWKEKPVLGVFSDFIDGQPSNKDNEGKPENCLVLTASGWNDVGCDLGGFPVTCESVGPLGHP
ncbi:MAG: C-type lectin domain-containing protein [Myxococcales bacterium]|nr:MAG: C-type lectin domain-containing protein [Myxococcales bacterium]